MTRAGLQIAVGVILALSMGGCGGDSRYVGTWRIDEEATKANFAGLKGAMLGTATALVNWAECQLVLQDDGTARGLAVVGGQRIERTGRWSSKDGDLPLVITRADREGVEFVAGALDSSGKLRLQVKVTDGLEVPVVLTRAP